MTFLPTISSTNDIIKLEIMLEEIVWFGYMNEGKPTIALSFYQFNHNKSFDNDLMEFCCTLTPFTHLT